MKESYMKESYMKEDCIINLFPQDMQPLMRECESIQKDIQEIRLRVDKPLMLYRYGQELSITPHGNITSDLLGGKVFTEKEITRILSHLCQYSIYAYENQIGQGFLTVFGGHRIGICGETVIEDERIKTIKNIQSMNIRISHELLNAADIVLPWVYHSGILKDTLIIARPGAGKTTLLRDLIRQISNGNAYGKGVNVSVVDERSELAACYMGQPQNDLGLRTDIMDGCRKSVGMQLMIRTMSPEVLAVDELGEKKEIDILRKAKYSGCNVIASIHGGNLFDVSQEIRELFDVFILLSKKEGKCNVKNIWKREIENGEIVGAFDDNGRQHRNGICLSTGII